MSEGPRSRVLYGVFVALTLAGAVVSGALLAVRGHERVGAQRAARASHASAVRVQRVIAAATGPDGGLEPVATVLAPATDAGGVVAPSGEASAPSARAWPPALLNPAANLQMSWDLALGRPNSREVLFTFDDGPNPGTTDRLLNILDRAHIKSIFYVCGWRLETEEPLRTRGRNILRDAYQRGHVIGNHTVHHPNMATLNAERTRYEVQHNADVIEEVIGVRPHLFRPPYGSYSEDLQRHLANNGMELSLWSVDSHDWQMVGDAQRVAMNVIRLLGNMAGGTVLMHDTHPWSVSAAQMVFRWLETENREREARGRPVYRVVDAAEFIAGARERLPMIMAEREAAQRAARRRREDGATNAGVAGMGAGASAAPSAGASAGASAAPSAAGASAGGASARPSASAAGASARPAPSAASSARPSAAGSSAGVRAQPSASAGVRAQPSASAAPRVSAAPSAAARAPR